MPPTSESTPTPPSALPLHLCGCPSPTCRMGEGLPSGCLWGRGQCVEQAPWAPSLPRSWLPDLAHLPASTVFLLFARYEVDDIDEEGKE